MQLFCLRLFACLLALVVKSCCGRAPALPTRVALLELGLATTNEKLTTIDTKIDNLSKDTNKMIDNLSKDMKTMFEKLDKKLDEIAANQIAFSKHNTFMFHAHNVWLTVLTIVGGMLNIDNARGWFKK